MPSRVWCLCLLVLGGCGASVLHSEFNASWQTWEQEIAACEGAYPDEHKKPVRPRVECFNRANEARGHRDGDADLVRAMTTQMLVEAEKYDAGQLSPAAYDASRAQIFADFQTKLQQRMNSNAVADAARSQALAAWNANLPKTTHCTTIGNSTTCR